MATDRPRVQAYLEPETHERLKQWQEEHGLKESQALNEILKQFFGMSPEPIPATPPITQEDIEKIVRDEVNQLFRVQMEENADFWTNRFSERLVKVEQSLERFISSSHEQISELKEDLGNRLATCEDTLETVLGESATPTSNSLDLTRSPEPETGEENGNELLQPIDANAIEALIYRDLKEDAKSSELPSELNLSQLARRLGVSKSVVSRRKTQADFEEWAKAKDPEAIAWRYDREKTLFVPF